MSVLHSHFLSGLCCPQASHSAFHVWEVTGGPKPGHAGSCPHLPALSPLLGRLVVWSCAFSRSCRSLLPLPGFCFNLSVAEMQSTQRAYFYQRFPILHLEPGDWPPGVAALVCGASRAVASASAASSCPLALLPDCPALVRPALWEGSPHRRPLVENQPNQETSRYRS